MKARRALAVTALTAASTIPASAYADSAPNTLAAAGAWRPEPAAFGVSRPVNVSVRMDDGTMISAEVVYPADPATGTRAAGAFPVLLTQTPYGATHGDPTLPGDYFAQRGYIYVASAVRGTGTSGGQVAWFGSRQAEDGAELVAWAAHALSGSDGKVGLDGCSYLGVDQWFTAAAVGRDSALRTITPFCTDSDFYEDLTAGGGIPTSFVSGIGQLEPRGPQDNPSTDPQSVTIAQESDGGPRSYDNGYWRALDGRKLIRQIVANGIPALSEAGWKDLFPGGDLGDYVAAQNAYFHRPLAAPIKAGAPVTGRYQAIVGPWWHSENVNGLTLEDIRLEWFDTWLKGERTGMADTSTPLHVFENTANQWVDTAAWPPSPTTRSYYLGAGGALSSTNPSAAGSDTLSWAATATNNALTYTSAPLTSSRVLDGPTDVTVYAASTGPDVELTATLNVVAPNGTVVKQADGVLLGSQRALDKAHSWYGADGALLSPSHPYTQESQQPVIPGVETRFDISLYANFTLIPASDKIQLVLTSQPPAGFHQQLVPTPQALAHLENGVYTVGYGIPAPSVLNLPLASPAQFAASPTDWGPSF